MTDSEIPKYALVGGREAVLLEAVPHAFAGGAACVFRDDAGNRAYVAESEWLAAAAEFLRYAAKRRIVTSESSGKDKVALSRALFRGREISAP